MLIPDVLAEKVNRLLTLLTSHKLPNDDTLLEKLLDWIDGVVHGFVSVKRKDQTQDSAWQFLKTTSAVEFLNTCSTMNDCNAELLTFALKLCSRVVDVYFTELETDHIISALLENASTPDHWDHPSVRCAMLQMLHRTCHTSTGRCWFLQRDCVTHAKKCLLDRSIFVVNVAIKLMSLYIIDQTQGQSQHLQEMWDFIMQPFHSDTQSDVIVEQTMVPLQRSLSVLHGVCKDTQVAKMLVSERDLIGRLCDVFLLRTDCAKSYEAALDLISLLFNTNGVSETDYSRLKKTALRLAETDHFLAAVQLSRRLLYSCGSHTEDPTLNELLQLPLRVTVSKNQQHLTDALWEHMKCTLVDRGAHTQLLRECLTALRDLKVRQDCLPMLAALLACTQNEADLGSSPLVTNMVGCTRIQQLTMDVLCQTLEDDNLTVTEKVILQIFNCCVTFLNSSLTSAAICGKTFQCLCLLLSHLSLLGQLKPAEGGRKEEVDGVLDVLQVTLQRSLCDMKWETRDSAVEFIGSLVSQMRGSDVISEWVVDSGVTAGVWQCVTDGESYVRAAALTSLGCLCEVTRVWQHLTLAIGQNDIIEKVTDVIENDTEAFARRAAIDLLATLQTHDLIDSSRSHDIEKVMQNAIFDFDWEVKLRVLAFWEDILVRLGSHLMTGDRRGNDDITNELQPLCDSGGLVVLLEAFDDYDKAVQKKVCAMLKTLKTRYCVNDVEMVADDMSSEDNNADCVNNYRMSRGRKKETSQDVAKFIRWLSLVDLDSVCVAVGQSTDEYADNPESLMDDLLTSLERIEHMTDTDGEESGEENIIDCY